MPPQKRKLPPPIKEKVSIPTICYCSQCVNKGEMVGVEIYKCMSGVNSPYGNHSIINCIKFKQGKK